MQRINGDIKESFEALIVKLEEDGTQYSDLRPENHENLKPIA